MKKIILALTFVLLLNLFACSLGTNNGDSGQSPKEEINYSVYPTKKNIITDSQLNKEDTVQFPSSLWTNSNPIRVEQNDYEMYGASGYYLQTVDYKGKESYCFAYVKIPEDATEENKVPAIVLVHGGGGTAFADWVDYWAELGYAAISIDTEGHIPTAPGATSSKQTSKNSPMTHGPARQGSFTDSNLEYQNQWMYHAVADVISAVTYMSSLPEVDATKIGCLGISWGSVIITCTAKYDDRIAFFVPVYGGIGLSSTQSREGIAIDLQPKAVALWDNTEPLKLNKAPFFFVSGPSDHAFCLQVQENCSKNIENKQFLFIDGLTHNHYAYMSIKEIPSFCNNIVMNEQNKIPVIKKQPTSTDSVVEFDEKYGKIVKAKLYTSTDTLLPANAVWNNKEITITDGKVNISVDNSVKHYYVIAENEYGNRISSQLVTL